MKKAIKLFLSLSLAVSITIQSIPAAAAELQVSEDAVKAEAVFGNNETEVSGDEGTEEYTPAVTSDKKVSGVKNNDTTLDMELYARYNSGAMSADGGSLEIVEYNQANGYAYAVSGIKGKIIAVSIADAEKAETVTELSGTEYDIKGLVESADGYGSVCRKYHSIKCRRRRTEKWLW